MKLSSAVSPETMLYMLSLIWKPASSNANAVQCDVLGKLHISPCPPGFITRIVSFMISDNHNTHLSRPPRSESNSLFMKDIPAGGSVQSASIEQSGKVLSTSSASP